MAEVRLNVVDFLFVYERDLLLLDSFWVYLDSEIIWEVDSFTAYLFRPFIVALRLLVDAGKWKLERFWASSRWTPQQYADRAKGCRPKAQLQSRI